MTRGNKEGKLDTSKEREREGMNENDVAELCLYINPLANQSDECSTIIHGPIFREWHHNQRMTSQATRKNIHEKSRPK